jgi:hypothetical protein
MKLYIIIKDGKKNLKNLNVNLILRANSLKKKLEENKKNIKVIMIRGSGYWKQNNN